MKVINRAGMAHMKEVSRPIFEAVKSSGQCLPTFSGQPYAQLAKAIVCSGQGKIVIAVKVSDTGQPQYLFDNKVDTNRLYCYVDTSGNVITPAGVTKTVNSGGSVIQFGVVELITLEGDFTGLELGNLFANNLAIFPATVQVFSFSYSDDIGTPQRRKISYNFLLPSPQSYILPDDCFVSRSFWNEALPTALYTPVIVADLDADKLYMWEASGFDDPSRVEVYYGGAWVKLTSLAFLSGESAPQVRFNGGSVQSGEISIREVPNAIILKNTPANIADMFEQVVQHGDGHYRGAKNLWKWNNGAYSTDSAYALITGLPNDAVEENELYEFEFRHDGPVTGAARIRIGNGPTAYLSDGVVTGERNAGSGSGRLYIQSGAEGATGAGYKGVIRHKIPLSDYLQKRHQIEQIKAAEEAYIAKKKERGLVSTDGLDDHVLLDRTAAFTGPFLFRMRGVFGLEGYYCAVKGSSDQNERFLLLGGSGVYWRAQVLYSLTAEQRLFTSDGQNHVVDFERLEDMRVRLVVDGEEYWRSASPITGAFSFDSFFAQYSGSTSVPFFDGEPAGVLAIDYDNPLPIDQGGNSGFWPLDGSTAIAEQKLGLDKKGKIVAKAGIAEKVVYDHAGTFSLSDGNWHTLHADVDVFEAGAFYLVEIDATQITSDDASGGYIQAGHNHGQDALGRWRPHAKAGEKIIYPWKPVSTVNVSIQKSAVPLQGEAALKITKLLGHGEWQGLSANLSEIQPVTRNIDGALLGDDLWNGATNFTVNTNVTGAPVSPGELYSIAVTGLTSGHNFNVYAADGWTALSEGESIIIEAFGAVLEFKDFAESQAGLVLSIRKALPLSQELQRQHDLEIVQKQFDKRLKRAEKSMDLIRLDAIDDKALIPEIHVGEECVTTLWFTSETIRTMENLLGANSATPFELLLGDALFTWSNGTLTTATPDVKGGILHRLDIEVFKDLSFELRVDHNVISTHNGPMPSAYFNVFGNHASAGNRGHDGYIGPLAYLSKANPKSSRFYIHSNDRMIDLMSEPVVLIDNQDYQIDLSIHDVNAGLVNIDAVPAGVPYSVSGDNQTGKELWHWVGDVAQAVRIPAGKFSLSGVTQAGFETALRSAFGQTPASGLVKGLTVKLHPTDGAYVGFPVEGSGAKAFKKKGDNLFGEELWPYGSANVHPGTAQYGVLVGSYSRLLDAGKEYEVIMSWVNLSGRLRIFIGDSDTETGLVVNDTNSVALTTTAETYGRIVVQEQDSDGSVADSLNISIKEKVKGA